MSRLHSINAIQLAQHTAEKPTLYCLRVAKRTSVRDGPPTAKWWRDRPRLTSSPTVKGWRSQLRLVMDHPCRIQLHISSAYTAIKPLLKDGEGDLSLMDHPTQEIQPMTTSIFF